MLLLRVEVLGERADDVALADAARVLSLARDELQLAWKRPGTRYILGLISHKLQVTG